MADSPESATSASANTDTSASEENGRFFRYQVQHKTKTPPSMHADMSLSTEIWDDFWLNMKPLIRRLDLVAIAEGVVALMLGMGFLMWFFVFYNPTDDGPSYISSIVIGIVWLLFMMLERWGGWQRQEGLARIQEFFLKEEARTFLSLGYALECEYEHVTGRNSAFFVTFLPMKSSMKSSNAEGDSNMCFQNGYFRITVLDELHILNDWSNSKLPVLPNTALPRSLDALSNDDWTTFLNNLGITTKALASAQRIFHWCLLGFACLLIALVVLLHRHSGSRGGSIVALCYFVVVCAFLTYFLHASRQYQKMEIEQAKLAREYANQVKPAGVLVKYRKLGNFHILRGNHMCHYLFVYPPINSVNTDETEASELHTVV